MQQPRSVADLMGPIFNYYACRLDGVLAGLSANGYQPIFMTRGGVTLGHILNVRNRAFSNSATPIIPFQISRVIATIARIFFDENKAMAQLEAEIGYELAQPIFQSLFEKAFLFNGVDVTGLVEAIPSDQTFQQFIRSNSSASGRVLGGLRKLGEVYATYIKASVGDQPLALIDTGWAGSIQNSLYDIVDNPIFGVYFGRELPMKGTRTQLESIGLMFDRVIDSNEIVLNHPIEAISEYRHLVEHLLEPNCETVHTVFPSFEGYSTNLVVADLKRFGPAQRKALDAIHKYIKQHARDPFSKILAAYEIAAEELAKKILKPSQVDLADLGSFTLTSDFGKRRNVPVLLPPQERFEGDSSDQRIKDAIWTAGQAVVEGKKAKAFRTVERKALSAVAAKPLVQVVTRTKDRPLFLRRALASVAKQSYSEYILTVINDGGDPTLVDKEIATFPYPAKIKVIHNSQSRGMEAASNKAIASTASELIIIHDDDDSWEPAFLEEAVTALGDGSVQYDGIVTQSTAVYEEVIGEAIQVTSKELFMPWVERVDLTDLGSQNLFPPIAFLFTRAAYDAVGGYDEEFRVLGDWDFNLRFVASFRIGFLKKPLANYHHRPNVAGGAAANSIYGGRNLHSEFLAVLRHKYAARWNGTGRDAIFNVLSAGQVRAEIANLRDAMQQLKSTSSSSSDAVRHCAIAACYSFVENGFMRRMMADLLKTRKITDSSVATLKAISERDIRQATDLIYQSGVSVGLPSFFDEAAYLKSHPDVAKIVKAGQISSGFEHFVRWGIHEQREMFVRAA